MTLARGSIRGYDDDRMVLLFSMMDGTREVLCAVSGSAMDDLEHVPRTPADQREEQFTRLRDRIEACASRKFLGRSSKGFPPASSCAASTFTPNRPAEHENSDERGGRGLTVTTYNYGVETVRARHPTQGDKAAPDGGLL